MARVWLSLGVLLVVTAARAAEAEGEAKAAAAHSHHSHAMVRVEFAYVELPMEEKDAAKPPRLDALPKGAKVLVQGEVTSLEGQTARIQLSRREPRIAGVNTTGPGRMSRSVSFENVGVQVSITPTVDERGRIALQIEFEDSRTGPVEEGTLIAKGGDGDEVRMPRVEIATLKLSVAGGDGESLLVGGMTSDEKSSACRALFVTPHIVPVGGTEKSR